MVGSRGSDHPELRIPDPRPGEIRRFRAGGHNRRKLQAGGSESSGKGHLPVYRFRRLHFPSALLDRQTVLITQMKQKTNRRGFGMVDAQIGFKAIVARQPEAPEPGARRRCLFRARMQKYSILLRRKSGPCTAIEGDGAGVDFPDQRKLLANRRTSASGVDRAPQFDAGFRRRSRTAVRDFRKPVNPAIGADRYTTTPGGDGRHTGAAQYPQTRRARWAGHSPWGQGGKRWENREAGR